MNKSESITNLGKALGTFHASCPAVKKDATNPHFKSTYTSLDSILETIKAPLKEAGLSFAQVPEGTNGLSTILIHNETGEFLEARYEVPLSKNDPQGAGSALTYMRRYALGAILGLATEEDDDGNKASAPKSSGGVQEATGDPLKEDDFVIF